jgi:hypothetical protein
MRKFTTYAFAALAVIVVVAPAKAADHPQKPGKWRMTFQMEMPGMPMKMPPVTHEICLTAEDLKDPQKAVPNDPKSQCRINDYRVEGSTVSWTIDCPKQNMKGNGQVTYAEDTYSGWLKMKVGDQDMTTKYSGKWIGECTK